MADRDDKTALEACGVAGPLVLGVEEPGVAGISWRVLDQPFVVVGRDPSADLVLKGPAMSRRHAYLQMIAGRLFCIDLQSRTGTHWGDEPGLWGWVDPRAGVRVGPYRILARDQSTAIGQVAESDHSSLPIPVSRAFEQPDLPEMTLEVGGLGSVPATWQASRALILIGRSRSCKIRLASSDIAEIHAAILRTPAGAFAIDLLGPNGILVNGRTSRCSLLAEGDELSIGRHTIRFLSGPVTNGSAPRPDHRAAFPALVTGMEGNTTSLVRVMIDELGLLQEHAAMRSRDDLLAVLQSFVSIHQEQISLIREELSCLRSLTQEQAALRQQVEGRTLAVRESPVLRLVSGESRAPVLATSMRQSKLPRSLALAAGVEGPARSIEPLAPPLATVAPAEEEAFHARIFECLGEIQGERQGRWQKLMESLLGKGS